MKRLVLLVVLLSPAVALADMDIIDRWLTTAFWVLAAAGLVVHLALVGLVYFVVRLVMRVTNARKQAAAAHGQPTHGP